jgi:glycosyltransferase involved in cell wall biosynthesis
MIDSYCIVDTGSTDDTREIIKNFFDSKGIEGKVVDFPFTNYEECRNVAIDEGKSLGEWGFWMDADEVLELNKDFSKTKMGLYIDSNNVQQMMINCNYNTMNYNRAQFYKFSAGFEWYGPLHEVLRIKEGYDANIRTGTFDLGQMKIIPDGASWKDDISVKYEKHSKILLKYQEENDWEDPRWTFYLAQSYRDAGNTALMNKSKTDERGLALAQKSINYYRERALENKGYQQERYFSQLMVARLSSNFISDEAVLVELLKCEELNFDNRCEHLFNIISYLQSQKLFRASLVFSKDALRRLKVGTTANLFLESTVYDWSIYDLHGVNLFYTGQVKESLKYFKYALKKANETGKLDDYNKKRMEDNVKSTEDHLRGGN